MRIVALEYHDVIDGDAFERSGFPGGAAATYKLTSAAFRAHCAAVRDAGVALASDVRSIDGTPAQVALFTFDDGGVSALHPTADILEEFGCRGHFFVTTSMIGTATFVSGTDARALRARGHVVGSHSHTHPTRMSTLSARALLEEWRESRARLQDVLGEAVDVASVPGGYYAHPVARAAAEAGLRWLFTSEPETRVHEVDGCHVFGRYTLRRDSPPSMAKALVSTGASARLKEALVWSAKKTVKRVGGEAYLRFRSLLLDR